MTEAAEDSGYIRRTGVSTLVQKLLLAEHGKTALVQRDISPQLRIPEWVPADYRQGITVAREVRWEAGQVVEYFVRRARGDGVSWAELAEPMLGDTTGDDDPATTAFRSVAWERTERLAMAWTCGTCRGDVIDFGPNGDFPTDRETGHTSDCARQAAEIAAFRVRHAL